MSDSASVGAGTTVCLPESNGVSEHSSTLSAKELEMDSLVADGEKEREPEKQADAEEPGDSATSDASKGDGLPEVEGQPVEFGAKEEHKKEARCMNFFKVGSPQKLLSKLIGKREPKSPKSSPARENTNFKGKWPEFVYPEGTKLIHTVSVDEYHASRPKVERIDYASLAEERIIPTFLGSRPCYDIMPLSGKVVVLSVDLLVKNAFSALVSNDVRSAPLWDATMLDFVGMLTITDFINVLRHYYKTNKEDIKDIENQSIATWRRITNVTKPFVKINGMDSLAQATKLLIQKGVHRLPVFDEKRHCVLNVLTRKRLLFFLSQHLFENFDKTNVRKPSFFKKSVNELQIGTFENLATIDSSTKLIDALDIFVERKVSALPLLDESGTLVDVFEKLDVFALAKDQSYYDLTITVEAAINNAKNAVKRLMPMVCRPDDSLETVINKMVTEMVCSTHPCSVYQAHRVLVVDEENHVLGLISLTDILKFLVVQPLVLMESSVTAASETIEETAEAGASGETEKEPEETVSDVAQQVAELKVDSEESGTEQTTAAVEDAPPTAVQETAESASTATE